MNDEELKKHYTLYGKNENREYSSNDLEFILSHKNIRYNIKNINDISNHIIDLFNDIHLFFINNIKKYNFFDNININFFDNIIENKLLNNIKIFKLCDFNNFENALIINNDKINFNYLQYHKISIKKIFENNNFDIIDLSLINNRDNFYKIIKNKINIIESNNLLLDAYYITKNGYKKILENYINNIDLLNNCLIGYYSRPLFNYNIKNDLFEINDTNINFYLSKNLWDSYYRVTSYWDKLNCINLGFDINKRQNMIKYCNLLNSKEEDFFYDGILGINLPNINTLINMGIYNSFVSNKFNIKTGTIGLNITQLNLMNESINNNYTLILEDDIYFNENYFEILDIIFDKYKDIDILYLGCDIYGHNKSDIFDKIDCINNYTIYKPKKNLLEKICLGGFFSVLLSKKALKIYIERFTPIDNVSDILLCDISFDIKNDFSNNTFLKTNYNLNTIIIDDFIHQSFDKPSLTEENNFDMLTEFKKNKYIIFLSKIKKFKFKIERKYIIKIYISEYINLYYKKIVDIIKNIIDIKIINFCDENTDIVLYTVHDNIILNNININICINGENRDCQELTDIAILSRKKYDYTYNIYFPQLFTSLWERKKDYSIIKDNKKENFCAYMYSYDVEYRVELFNFISKYKKVDALGKSCSTITDDDRYTYTDELTYNDIAIEKYSKYKFVLALENTICDGYITEKLINPILANSIPIYAGSKDAFSIINKKRVIYVYDFNDYNELLEYITKVDNDESLYNLIIAENIFVGNINFSNFEDYLSIQIKKALGLEPKNILLTYGDNIINYDNIDFIIKDFYISYSEHKLIKRYLSDYINKDDNLII